jgi:hypothetical protein
MIFRLKGEKLPISGTFFEFQVHKVNYLKNGKKRQSLNYQDFEKLVSITYGQI